MQCLMNMMQDDWLREEASQNAVIWAQKITLLYLYHMIEFSNITPARVLFFPEYLYDIQTDSLIKTTTFHISIFI